jgi:hypothetical protein
MKKRFALTLLCICVIISGAAISQGIYFKAGGAYRLGLPATLLAENSTDSYTYQGYYPYNSTSTSKDEGVYGTFGKGVSLDGAIGYKGENLGFEVGVTYLFKSSLKSTYKYVDIYQSSPTSSTVYSNNSTYTYESSMIAFAPCFVFATNLGFYGRAGAVLAFPKYSKSYHSERSTPTRIDQTAEYSGNLALGFTGAIGITIGTELAKFFVEADIVSLTWAPARGELTQYKVDGKNMLPEMTVSQKKTRFEDIVTYNSATTTNTSIESKSLKQYIPYSSVGLKAGIMIGF